MDSNDNKSSYAERTHFRERLLPLLYRYASAAHYRRSRRYGRHHRHVGAGGALAAPALTELLAEYLVQRLPARVVARLGAAGLLRAAAPLAAAAAVVGWMVYSASRVAGFTRRLLRMARGTKPRCDESKPKRTGKADAPL